jgi:hypothetical protein
MKKILYSLSIIAVLFMLTSAAPYNKSRTTTADLTLYSGSAKSFLAIGGGGTNDTLRVTDTVTYIVAVSAANDLLVSGQTNWKHVTGHPTLTFKYWQSWDGVNYFQLYKGISRALYTTTTAAVYGDTAVSWSFRKDTVNFEGKYLKIVHISNGATSAKGCLTDYVYIKRR